MKMNDLISMALKNLLSRKSRTFLTILGVVIGATSIIIMLSLGFGFSKAQQNFIESMGDLTTISIHPSYEQDLAKNKKLNDVAVKELKKIKHVTAVSPIMSTEGSLSSGRLKNDWVHIIALDPETMQNFGYEVSEGKLLDKNDKKNVVFGPEVATNFRDEKRPNIDTSDKIKPMKNKINLSIENYTSFDENDNSQKKYEETLKVIGVLESSNDWESNMSIFMSIDYFNAFCKAAKIDTKNLKQNGNTYQSIKVKVDDIDNVESVNNIIKDNGYESSGLFDWLEETKKSSMIFQAIFGGIGAIAFLVAAIGISNTMVMSIYERTKEIGVMKVIGASISDIKKLFLTEAGFIGLFGGILGVINSFIISKFFNIIAQSFLMNGMGVDEATKISIIPFWLVIIAITFSTFVGVLSGYFPARRAMKLSALDAIRSE